MADVKSAIPWDAEVERSVLASLFLEPSVIEQAMPKDEYFHDARHRTVFQAMKAVRMARLGIDILTVSAQLRNERKLEMVGGELGLVEIQSSIESTANYSAWVSMLDDLAFRRKVLAGLPPLLALAQGAVSDESIATSLKEKASRLLGELASGGSRKIISMKAKLREVGEAACGNSGQLAERIPYNVSWADEKMTHYRSQIHAVGGFPGTGKTAWALSVANGQVDSGLKVCYVCTESKGVEILARALGQRAGLSASRLMEGCGSDILAVKAIKRELGALAPNINNFGVFGLGEFDLTIEGVAGVARRFAFDAGGVDMLILDYLQDLRLANQGRKSKREDSTLYDRVSWSIEGFKSLVEELNCAGLVLSQFNRDSAKQGKPTKSSFKGSGDIEQACHIMSVLYREGDDAAKIADGSEVLETWWYSVKTRLMKPFCKKIGFRCANQQYVELAAPLHKYGEEDLPDGR